MPSAPIPCTNCKRFHYGACFNKARQCRDCGGLNHIERYCPDRRRVRWTDGPMPGTRNWCAMWGLNDDHHLREKVLAAIKNSPDSAIWIDGRCIYEGYDRHFHTERGRQIENPHVRSRRSMSPPRERQRGSPSRRPTFRSRSPLRRRQSRSRSPNRPRFADEPRNDDWPSLEYEDKPEMFSFRQDSRIERHETQRQPPRYLSDPTLPLPQREIHRPALGDITNKPRNQGSITKTIKEVSRNAKETESCTEVELFPYIVNSPSKHRKSPPRTLKRREEKIEDPHFVLGISIDASEEEICQAHRARVWEVRLDEMADNSPGDDDPDNLYCQSIRILAAAKRELVGY